MANRTVKAKVRQNKGNRHDKALEWCENNRKTHIKEVIYMLGEIIRELRGAK